MWVRKSDRAGSGLVKIGERNAGSGNGGSGVDSEGAAKEEVPSVDSGRRVSRWVMSAVKAGPRAKRDGSYVDEIAGLVECVDRAISKALDLVSCMPAEVRCRSCGTHS